MGRPQAIAVVLAAAGLVGLFVAWRPTVAGSALACDDGGVIALGPDGVARCAPGAPLPAGQALTLKQKFDCNRATEAELALVPGIGPSLAHELVVARGAGFRSWDEIDAVNGVGSARLNALQAACDIRESDAGVW